MQRAGEGRISLYDSSTVIHHRSAPVVVNRTPLHPESRIRHPPTKKPALPNGRSGLASLDFIHRVNLGVSGTTCAASCPWVSRLAGNPCDLPCWAAAIDRHAKNLPAPAAELASASSRRRQHPLAGQKR